MQKTAQIETPTQTMMNNKKQADLLYCPKCDCSFFEQIAVHQFTRNHNVIIGQEVLPHTPVKFLLFKCVKCGELIEPNIQAGPRDSAFKKYNEFLDEMEKKLP